MLDTLLRILSEGGTYSPSDLAQELGVGEGLVRQMIEDLTALGYLSPLADSCGMDCGQCPDSANCCASSPSRAWQLTAKGRRAAVAEDAGQ
jgi:predicted ArsR family transcriptional regulator